MIDLIARHLLIYRLESSKEQIFDFSVEESWGCLPMPSRCLWEIPRGQESTANYLTQPKPDLTVCFKRQAVISDQMWKTLPEPTKRLTVFENPFANGSRVFHFLAIEAKKAMLNLNAQQALNRCLNNASQALHNFYEFFRDAGPEHEQIFYDKVRFFSIVANRNGILVRIHRAIRKSDDANPWELILPDQSDYRLEFEFREFQRVSGMEDFTRDKVLEVMRKNFKYARDDLSKLINAAASKFTQNVNEDPGQYHMRREIDFYSHGQPNPKKFKSSRHTSVLLSTIGDGVQRQSGRANLSSNRPSLGQSMASGQETPRQTHQSIISSEVVTTTNKRRAEESGIDDPQENRAISPPVRKRGRPRRAQY